MKRKIILLIMTLIIIVSTSSTILAVEKSNFKENKQILLSTIDISEEIDNALSGITDDTITEDLMNQIDFEVLTKPSFINESIDFKANEELDVKYTLKNVGLVLEDDSKGTMYSLTAVAKQKEDSANNTEDGVYCYISIIWIDNFGDQNELVKVLGGWEPNGRTLSNRQVYYGVADIKGSFIEGKYSVKNPTSNQFEYNAPSSYKGFSLRAHSWVDSDGYPYGILCNVKSSIFTR